MAAESLYRGWDAGKKTYTEVPATDREWLLGQLNRAKNEYKLPVIAIDYVPPADRELARATARRILGHGFIPYVADPAFESLGVSAVEAMPRKMLMLYRNAGDTTALAYESILRFVAMPLNWMGYVPEYVNLARDPLPAGPLAGRYAGIVTWIEGDLGGRGAEYAACPRSVSKSSRRSTAAASCPSLPITVSRGCGCATSAATAWMPSP